MEVRIIYIADKTNAWILIASLSADTVDREIHFQPTTSRWGSGKTSFPFFNLLFFKKNSLKCQGKTIRKSGSSSMNSLSGTIGSKVPGVKQPYFSGLTSPTAEI